LGSGRGERPNLGLTDPGKLDAQTFGGRQVCASSMTTRPPGSSCEQKPGHDSGLDNHHGHKVPVFYVTDRSHPLDRRAASFPRLIAVLGLGLQETA